MKNTRVFPVKRLIRIVYAVMMFVILGTCIFGSGIYYSRKTDTVCAEPILFIGGVLITVVLADRLYWLFEHVFKNRTNERKVLLVISVCLMAFQCYCVWCYYFSTDWDVEWVMTAAEAVAHGESMEEFEEYFSTYPNNLFLVWLYGAIIRIFQWININYKMGILLFQCILSWITGLLLFDTTKQILKSRSAAWFAWIMYIILIGMSPWVSIPYSDSIGLVFPISILWFWLRMEKNVENRKWQYAVVIGLLTATGYRIKPQIVIITIAICIIFSLDNILKNMKAFLRIMGSLIVGMLVALLITSTCISTIDITIDSDSTFGMTHFLMMGLNYSEGESGNGVWNSEDVKYSRSFSNAKKRKEGNLQVASERVKEMGMTGMAHLMRRKILTDYNDGTFCWGGEGVFFGETLSTKNHFFASFLRNVYYGKIREGRYFKWFYNSELAIWLAVLLLGTGGIFYKNKKELTIVMLAIIGLTIFELIFEARARYLYTYVPLYIILAAAGVQKIVEKKNNLHWL